MKKFCDTIITLSKTIFISCAVSCVVLVLLGILPLAGQHASLKKELAEYEATLDEQRLYSPVYKAILLENAMLFPQGTPEITFSQRPPEDISELLTIIGKKAIIAGVEPVNITPYPDSFSKTGDAFKVGCDVRGSYSDLQKFLINLSAMTTLESIEEMAAIADPDGVYCSLQLRFALHEKRKKQ